MGFKQFAGRGLRHMAEWRDPWVALVGWQSGVRDLGPRAVAELPDCRRDQREETPAGDGAVAGDAGAIVGAFGAGDTRKHPGTLTGFLLWLEHPSSPDLDLQPVVTTGDAVHVLTYHRAKGLEWPLVVCTDFDYEPLPRTWDVRVELTGTFDIEAPLKGREIRYWPNIFDRRRKGAPARTAIEESAEGRNCRERSRAEERGWPMWA